MNMKKNMPVKGWSAFGGKKVLNVCFLVLGSMMLSGCSLSDFASKSDKPVEKVPANSSFLKSFDVGLTWEAKMKVDEKKDISGVNVLSIASHPVDVDTTYIGTEANGIFVTKDGGESWTQVSFPQKVYGIALDFQAPETIYATGFNNKRGKIYKRTAAEEQWQEIYTEPSDETFVTALTMDRFNPRILYAGTNQGVILKTINGGESWINLKKADRPIVNITIDAKNSALVYFGIFQQGIWRSSDGGTNVEDITKNINQTGYNLSTSVYVALADPWIGGTIYLGTERGLIKSVNGGEKWEEINIIGSSKQFPIRSLAVNPFNSKEILYSSAKAIYRSTDSGVKWSTFQLDTKKDVSVIRYSPVDQSVVFIGMRSF